MSRASMTATVIVRALLLLACLLPQRLLAEQAPDSLVTVDSGTIAPLPAGEDIQRVVVIEGRAVALGARGAWVLDEKQNTWQSITWQAPGVVRGAVNDSSRAFLLLSTEASGRIERIERIMLSGNKLTAQALPALPAPLASAQGAVLSETLYIAGSDASGMARGFALNLAVPQSQWSPLEAWNGSGTVSSLVGQNSQLLLTQGDRLLRWKAGEHWSEVGKVPGAVVDGAARPLGQAHALYLLRADSTSETGNKPEPGSSREGGGSLRLMTYHTITGSWATLGEPKPANATTAAPWKTGLLWLQAPGNTLAFTTVKPSELHITRFDWAVLIVYLAGMSSIGLYFYLREKRQSTSDFFVGSRAIPFWAAGVSLYATNTSSISYIAIPAKAFETNWQYLTNNLTAVLGLMFVAVWIVPLLRRLDLMSVFHYLEIRFHPVIRTIASGLCIVTQIGARLSVVLFLPSLAISSITGLDVVWGILIMGGITIAYTALGGMKAVIWTDFVQLFVMFGGALFAIGFIMSKLDGGVGEFFAMADAADKTKLLDFSFDLTQATVWGFIFLVLFDVVLTFPKDQVLMQRVLSTKSAKQAGWSVWTFAAIMIPGGFMFYFIGTALYVYYKSHPERMDPLATLDSTFPVFIAAELPIGVVGLIIAGILAASMSTLSSIMNSVATLASVDFYEKLVKKPTPKQSVIFAEVMTVVTGLIGIGVALLLSRYDIHSLFDVSIELTGLLGGGFAGAYTLGMFTRRANWQGVSIGIGTSIVLTLLCWSVDLVHPYFYLAISILICIVVGYLASLLFPPPARSLTGLTIHDEKRNGHAVPTHVRVSGR